MFGTCFQLLITQKILLFVGPMDWLGAAFTSYFFSFFFFLQPPIPKLIELGASFFFFPLTPNTQTHRTQIALKPRKFISILNNQILQLHQQTQKWRGMERMRWIVAPVVDPNRSLCLSPSGFCFPTTPPNQTHLRSEMTH